MWKDVVMIGSLAAAVACSGVRSDADSSDKSSEAVDAPAIQGQWMIENVVENDSSYLRPSEIESGLTAYINFNEDKTFGVVTNCNHLGGAYTQSHDTIRMTDISTTEMACDNMEMEEMLKKILPTVNAVDCLNDSVMRLNTTKSDSYIVLKRNSTPQK